MRKGTVVYKYDQEGNLIITYSSMRQARKQERVRHSVIKLAIETHQPIQGHIFKMGEQFIRHSKQPTNRAPWEGEDGMFNVNGLLSMSF